MSSSETFVIVGASLAGAKAAEGLRDQGFGGRIVLIGAERHLPYERPPLSKGYLAGSAERDKVWVHPESWYAEHGIELCPGQARQPHRPRRPAGGTPRRQPVRLRQAAAGHRRPAADPVGARC